METDYNVQTAEDLMSLFEDSLFGGSSTAAFSAPQPMIKLKAKVEAKKEVIDFKREKDGTGYAKKYQEKEERMVVTRAANLPPLSVVKLDEEEDEEDDGLGIKREKEEQEMPHLVVYQRYQFNLNPQDLPILNRREEILRRIYKNSVVVLTASTGTGKSSQIPQYIIEEARKRKENCNIIIAQPRRIAAVSVAKRVALERKCELGTLVGYQIGLDKQMDSRANSDTRILFCTTGVLLQKLLNEKTMKKYSHVILDEAHERDVDIDMLLIIVRRLLAAKNPYVKIIVMSATLNAEKFASYFFDGSAPILDLNIKRPFPINITYLNDKMQHLGVSRQIIDMDKPGISRGMFKVAIKMMELVLQKSKSQRKPSFLIFLPGLQEINRFQNELYQPNDIIDISEYHLTILHSSIPTDNYGKAFDGSIDNKIILATNIAESSVTLPGVRFVIDFCLTKYQEVDTATKMTQLKLDWASKNSLEQRAGRVGRTEVGQVVRLIFEDQFTELAIETKPEMERISLESVVLKIKRLEMGKPIPILALALDPPPYEAIINSILLLKEIGAMTRFNLARKFDPKDGALTFVGSIMAHLPVDVKISKLIILGHMFSCLEDCVIIGAGLSTKNIFRTNLMSTEEKMEEYHQKLTQAEGTASDPIAILKVYRKWRDACARGLAKGNEKKWCEKQMLDLKNLRNMHDVVGDLKNRLKFFRMETNNDHYQFTDEEKLFVIKICIAGAFYPNYFGFGGTSPSRDEYKTINNMNPCTTVFFKGVEPNRIGQLYESQVRKYLVENGVCEDVNEMKVKFDKNSSKVHVEFKPFNHEGVKVPGDVTLEVYKAIKLCRIEKKMKLNVMSDYHNETIYAEETGMGTWKYNKFELRKKVHGASDYSIYPKLRQSRIHGKICNIINSGKFFFQSEAALEHIRKQQNFLSLESNCIEITREQVERDTLLLVKHENVFKRGKITEVPDEDDDEDEEFSAYLIDFGMSVKVFLNDLYTCKAAKESSRQRALKNLFEMPPQCFECRLFEVIPSAINCASGWSVMSTNAMRNFIDGRRVEIDVNSFVDRVASVRLIVSPPVPDIAESLNEHLLLNGYAQQSDEPYMSLLDQHERELESCRSFDHQNKLEDEFANDFPTPNESLLVKEMVIDGPFSPLELRLQSCCRSKYDDISIEQSSVNHVLFDPYPNDGCKKVLIATSISKRGRGVTLHQTTIMPHLPGMACLLGLIFSPYAEIHCSKKKQRYTSILTGLGCDFQRKPHFGEHDSLIDIDFEFDQHDFDIINKLRRKMSYFLQTESDIKSQSMNVPEKMTARNQICKLLLEILSKDRKPLGMNNEASKWEWKQPVKEDANRDTFPTHSIPEKLMAMSEITRRDLLNHAKEIQQLSMSNRDEIVFCRLCEETIETSIDLQLHLMKKLHKERLISIRNEPLISIRNEPM